MVVEKDDADGKNKVGVVGGPLGELGVVLGVLADHT